MSSARTIFPLDELARFVGYRFQTLDKGHAFTLVEVSAGGVYYERKTLSKGWLPIKAFQIAWHHLQSGAEASLSDLQGFLRRASPYRTDLDSSCFASLLASIEPVRYLKGPIRLSMANLGANPGMTYRPAQRL